MRPVLLVLVFFSFACREMEKTQLRIATAANMQFAMDELIKDFQKKSRITCELVISSSGKLSSQIREFAPFDVFISADTLYPNQLAREGFTIDSTTIYAYGKIVIWTIDPDFEPILDSGTLKKVQHIAIANPKTAPYGVAAIQFLKYNNLYERVEKKLVFGESISQTNHYIITGAAEIGITAKSIVLSPVLKIKGRWTEPETDSYQPIAQGMVILKNAKNQENALRFKEYVLSAEGRNILASYGYMVP